MGWDKMSNARGHELCFDEGAAVFYSEEMIFESQQIYARRKRATEHG
jgi:hypothetical protein